MKDTIDNRLSIVLNELVKVHIKEIQSLKYNLYNHPELIPKVVDKSYEQAEQMLNSCLTEIEEHYKLRPTLLTENKVNYLTNKLLKILSNKLNYDQHEIEIFAQKAGTSYEAKLVIIFSQRRSSFINKFCQKLEVFFDDFKYKYLHDYSEEETIKNKKDKEEINLKKLCKDLDVFCNFIKSNKRMTFWHKKGNNYKWVTKPEKYAKNLMHTFLKGKYGKSIDIFEELYTGAGRLDIYIKIDNLKMIIELKMCGCGYSLNYAKAGYNQLIHYIENKDTLIGFLIIFDGRLRDYGKGMNAVKKIKQYIVYTKFIDLRYKIKLHKK